MASLKDLADSSSRRVVHDSVQVIYCTKCGKRYYVASSSWELMHGKCDCSWHCCEAAKAAKHEDHFAFRAATSADMADARQGIIKDFTGK